MSFIISLPIVAFICWTYVERHCGFAARVTSGIACILLTGNAWQATTNFIPRHESDFHRRSLSLAGELMSKGDTQRVHQAIQAYNRIASTGSTYSAATEMLDVLNHDSKQSPQKTEE